jgi:hypothetical protein
VRSTSKCTCRDGVDGVDQVKTAVEQVKAGAEALGDWAVEDEMTCIEIMEEA